ncbi:MAG: IS5 family transposase [Aureispira sp.]|nr:IS5 family transposase [Aureispira sp.]
MIRYTPSSQLKFENFQTPFDNQLKKDNKWVRLAALIPWDACAKIYHRFLNANYGAPSINTRLVLGAIIIKHLKTLSDRDVVCEIQENIYLQYFVGFSSFDPEPSFDPSLFVKFRKRLGLEAFEEMNDLIVSKALRIEKEEDLGKQGGNKKNSRKAENPQATEAIGDLEQESKPETKKENKGRLKMDATVADQMIVYPTDLGLLNTARLETERMIDILHKESGSKKKPRTYRKKAKKDYLSVAMKKRKSKSVLRLSIGKQLRYLHRNIKTIKKMWDATKKELSPFNKKDLRLWWIIQELYAQQNRMYRDRVRSHAHRIVNIYQPYVRPIPRGKAKGKTEFGAKLGVSEYNGFCWLDTLSWEAYNEVKDLKKQVILFQKRTGHYPEVVLCDGIYLSRENRKWLKEKGIRHVGKPLGRPKLQTAYEKRKLKKERGMRNHIEGKFGQAKNAYGMTQIRARLQQTSESWIASLFLCMNLVKWLQTSANNFSFLPTIIPALRSRYNYLLRICDSWLTKTVFIIE